MVQDGGKGRVDGAVAVVGRPVWIEGDRGTVDCGLVDFCDWFAAEVLDERAHVTPLAAGLHVGHSGTYEVVPSITRSLGRWPASMLLDAFCDLSGKFTSVGSPSSSAARLHAEWSVGSSDRSPDFEIRGSAFTRRSEAERHSKSPLRVNSMRAISVWWKILSRPTGV